MGIGVLPFFHPPKWYAAYARQRGSSYHLKHSQTTNQPNNDRQAC